jgi:hypothetical protein
MEKVRLLNDEKIIKEVTCNIGFKQEFLRQEISKWGIGTATFTTKRVLFSTDSESLTYSYENISGIQFIASKLPPKIDKLFIIGITFF